MHDGSDDLYIERQAELLRERAAIDEFSEEELLRRPWGSALETLRSADVTLVTLETVATSTEIHWPSKRFLWDDNAGPRGSPAYHRMSIPNLQTLRTAGIDCVSLATNQ